MKKTLPDMMIQKQNSTNPVSTTPKDFENLNWVGMEGIEGVLNFSHRLSESQSISGSPVMTQLAVKADVFVNLSGPRGIHMSRLYRVLMDQLFAQKFSWSQMDLVLSQLLQSQSEHSDQLKLILKTNWVKTQKSLLTDLKGLRHYPLQLEWQVRAIKPSQSSAGAPSLPGIQKKHSIRFVLTWKILYSSTCPMSLALAKQVWSEEVTASSSASDYATLPAAPHAQRSEAVVSIELDWAQVCQQMNKSGDMESFFDDSIQKLEAAIRTPVQTSVKRQDEQEFARLNGQYPLFCEDAARVLSQEIQKWMQQKSQPSIKNFHIKVRHLESLHPFNAVAVATGKAHSV